MTRKSMKRDKADREFSLLIRERAGWRCERCFTPYPPPTRALHCAHMFSRGKLSTRWDPENAAALCFGCHRWLDTHPDLKRVWFRERLGDEAFDALELRSNTTKASAERK